MTQPTRVVVGRGSIGWVSFLIWLIVFGCTLAIPSFTLPGVVLGVWLIISAILMAVGV